MATFKNITDHQIDVPVYDLRIPAGATFEVPDEVAYSFANNPDFGSSRTQNPDTVADPGLVEAATPLETLPGTTPPAATN